MTDFKLTGSDRSETAESFRLKVATVQITNSRFKSGQIFAVSISHTVGNTRVLFSDSYKIPHIFQLYVDADLFYEHFVSLSDQDNHSFSEST